MNTVSCNFTVLRRGNKLYRTKRTINCAAFFSLLQRKNRNKRFEKVTIVNLQSNVDWRGKICTPACNRYYQINGRYSKYCRTVPNNLSGFSTKNGYIKSLYPVTSPFYPVHFIDVCLCSNRCLILKNLKYYKVLLKSSSERHKRNSKIPNEKTENGQ